MSDSDELASLRAEVAALREIVTRGMMLQSDLNAQISGLRTELDMARVDAEGQRFIAYEHERDLARARELLARATDWCSEYVRGHDPEWCDDARAFLDPRRDEAPCPCLQWEPEVRGSRSFHVPGCEYAPACDEARGAPDDDDSGV